MLKRPGGQFLTTLDACSKVIPSALSSLIAALPTILISLQAVNINSADMTNR